MLVEVSQPDESTKELLTRLMEICLWHWMIYVNSLHNSFPGVSSWETLKDEELVSHKSE